MKKRNQDRTRPRDNKPAAVQQPQTSPPGLREYIAKEFKVVALRDIPIPDAQSICETPPQAAEYWRLNIATHPYFNRECECLAVLILNSRRRVKGHAMVTTGTLDTTLAHAREVFRTAIIASAHAVILMHNHPSGEAMPSEGDIMTTRKMAQAGDVLGIEVLDHVIVTGQNPACPKGYASLRELGYFALPRR
jgi:DNA repair protein RadC